jgi:hypothetical protein
MGLALDRVKQTVSEERASRGVPELAGMDQLLNQAVLESIRVGGARGPGGEMPADRMKRLRDAVERELVAFHEALPVAPYAGDDLKAAAGCRLWTVGIPLTLFPRRDHGFSRIECLVEFTRGSDAAGLRVVAIRPPERTEVMARAEMGGALNLKGTGGLGLPMPAQAGLTVAQASGRVYATAEVGPLVYQAVRVCVATEIVRGTGARWRLDDARDPQRVGLESHQLEVIVEVAPGDAPVDTAGYLQAYSDLRWLTMSLGTFWKDFRGTLRALFDRGVPIEAYAEWEDILPA